MNEATAEIVIDSPNLESEPPTALLQGWQGRNPHEILEEAAKAAKELADVIEKAGLAVSLGPKTKPSRHLKVEAWTTVARFYGVAVRTGTPKYVTFDVGEGKVVRGFEVEAQAILVSTGVVISTATAYCMSDEEKWGERPKYVWEDQLDEKGRKIWVDGKCKSVRRQVGMEAVPLFQLASMAATRASSKVCRHLFSWVVVLAGYSPTPFEEVDGTLPLAETPAPPQGPPAPSDPLPGETVAGPEPLSKASVRIVSVEPKKSRAGVETWKVTLPGNRVVWTNDPEVAAVVSEGRATNIRVVMSTKMDEVGFEFITAAGPE